MEVKETIANMAQEQDEFIEQKKVNLDTILVNELGQFGKYQIKTMVLLGVVVVFVSWAVNEYTFTTSRIRTRCLIPECEGDEATLYTPSWILNAVPPKSNTFDNCQRFKPRNYTVLEEHVCPASYFDQDNVVGCDKYVYENTNSIVYDFGLACDEWRRSIVGSLRRIGMLVAIPGAGYVSDRWGRRMVITITTINSAFLGVLRHWSNSYYCFVIFEVLETVVGTGAYSAAYILVMEMVGPKYRVAAGATINTCISIGQMLLGLIAWIVPNWRRLTLILYLPQFLVVSYFWILTESVRWYITKERYENAEKALKKIARTNGKALSEKSLATLRQAVQSEKNKIQTTTQVQNSNELSLLAQLRHHKPMLKRVMITPIWWITLTFVNSGLSINSVNMSGNQYINFITASAVEIPGYWIAMYLMNKIGRKPVVMGSYWICAVCLIAFIFIPKGFHGLSLTLYFVGKCFIAMVVISVYVYTIELYPTKYRQRFFAFSSLIGRIGFISAPLTPALSYAIWDKLPFVLFAGLALFAGLLVPLQPETLGIKLPDTMEEASNIGVKKIIS